MAWFSGDTLAQSLEGCTTTIIVNNEIVCQPAPSKPQNPAPDDAGALKLACLTKTGDVAINACKRRLELTNTDGARMRSRLAVLEAAEQARQAQYAYENEPQDRPIIIVTPTSTTGQDNANEQQSVSTSPITITPPVSAEQLAFEARRAAYKHLVAEVQSRLNALGFKAGAPDGVPGKNTRNALRQFYETTGIAGVSSISDITLEDITTAENQLSDAEKTLNEAQTALKSGNTNEAKNLLTRAKETSALLQVPVNLAQLLPSISSTSAPSATTASASPLSEKPPTQSELTISTVNATATFNQLMNEIQILEGKLQREQAEQLLQLDKLRIDF